MYCVAILYVISIFMNAKLQNIFFFYHKVVFKHYNTEEQESLHDSQPLMESPYLVYKVMN